MFHRHKGVAHGARSATLTRKASPAVVGEALRSGRSAQKLPHEDVSYGSLFSLMELFDPIRRGVHDGKDEEGQDGGDDESARNGDGHRPPEDVEHERQHAENGSGCREHDGAQA